MRAPSKEFWAPIGQLTGGMNINDKINLLAYIVPRFGSRDAEQEASLLTYASGLEPTFTCIQLKCPDLSESDVQLLGTELLNAEILVPGRSTKEEFAAWLGAMTQDEMKNILSARKALNELSKSQLATYKVQQEEIEKEKEEIRKRYEEQMAEARKTRTIVFNPTAGKFQEIKKETKFVF